MAANEWGSVQWSAIRCWGQNFRNTSFLLGCRDVAEVLCDGNACWETVQKHSVWARTTIIANFTSELHVNQNYEYFVLYEVAKWMTFPLWSEEKFQSHLQEETFRRGCQSWPAMHTDNNVAWRCWAFSPKVLGHIFTDPTGCLHVRIQKPGARDSLFLGRAVETGGFLELCRCDRGKAPHKNCTPVETPPHTHTTARPWSSHPHSGFQYVLESLEFGDWPWENLEFHSESWNCFWLAWTFCGIFLSSATVQL